MIKLSGKARERLLYLISPIGLVVVWQLLLMAGIGDRRFIPAPSDIAQRFVKLIGNGELEWHVAVTLYRVFLHANDRCLDFRIDLRSVRHDCYLAMQMFLGSVKNFAFAKATARQAPRFARLLISLYKCF